MGEKSLVRNSFYNVLYKLLNILFPLLTSVYIARVLKADSIGKVAAAQNIASYFTLIAAMGIPTYGTKLIAQFKVRSAESSKAFFELFIINGVLSLVCSTAYYCFISIAPYYDGKRALYYIAGLNVLFNVFNVDWFYQGIQEYRYIAARSFVIKVLALASLVSFVRKQGNFYIYAFISSGAIVGNYLFNIIHIRKYIVLGSYTFTFEEHLRHILTLFAASIAVEVYVLADVTMLDLMCSSTIVGYYTMSMKVIRVVRNLCVAVSSVFLPQLSYHYYNGERGRFHALSEKGIHILCAISVPVALGVFLEADDAILLFFGDDFADSILTTRILSLSIITVAVSNYIGMQILVTIGKEKITTISTICGAFVNIMLNYFLIRKIQHNGAAVASVVTEATVMIIQIILSRKYVKLRYGLKSIICSAVIMSLIVVLLRAVIQDYRIEIFVTGALGAMVYFTAMILLKDDFALTTRDRIKRLLRRCE